MMARTPQPVASRWRLVRRRECWRLTWRGWLLLLLAAAGLTWMSTRLAYPFLAPMEPLPDGALVVEGWAGDAIMQAAANEIREHHYRFCFVTGGPMDTGAPLSEYQTFAELGAATLHRLGVDAADVNTVPAPAVLKDRTFAAAVALRDWLEQHNVTETNLTVMTAGPHARRTRLLFVKALGAHYRVGVMGMPPRNYDPADWWRSSEGFRTVTGEAIAYLYARLWF